MEALLVFVVAGLFVYAILALGRSTDARYDHYGWEDQREGNDLLTGIGTTSLKPAVESKGFSLFAADKSQDLSRPLNADEDESLNLFEIDKNKETNISAPIITKLDHSLFAQDKEDDLTRPFDHEKETRKIDLLELDQQDDLSRPF